MRGLFKSVERIHGTVAYLFPELMNQRSSGIPLRERELDPFEHVRETEDVLFSIASEVYRNRSKLDDLMMESSEAQGVFARTLHGRLNELIDEIDKAQHHRDKEYIRQQNLNFVKKWTLENNPDSGWAYAFQRMIKIFTHDVKVYTLAKSPDANLAFDNHVLATTLLQATVHGKLPVLIHGHFHVPRRGTLVIDDGCMFEIRENFEIGTHIRIDNEGNIEGPIF